MNSTIQQKMENFLLSDKNNYDIEYIIQNFDAYFDTIDSILSKSKDDKSLNDDIAKGTRIRVANLSIPSVYHNPQKWATQSELTESALYKLESEHLILTDQYKPYSTTSTLNYEKRISIVRYLLLYYYTKISLMSKQSKLAYIDMSIKACKTVRPAGTTHSITQQYHHSHQHHSSHDKVQFYLNSQIYIELLRGLYYLFYNGFSREAYKAIDTIAQKADDDLLCDVILMCNSIKNSIQLANSDNSDLNSSKNTLINASPMIAAKNSKKNSIGGASLSNNMASLGIAGESKVVDESLVDEDLNNDTISNNFDVDLESEQQSQSHQILERVYIGPSANQRDAARRASMKLKNAKKEIEENAALLEPSKEINEFTRLDDIPIIDDSNGSESVTNDEADDIETTDATAATRKGANGQLLY